MITALGPAIFKVIRCSPCINNKIETRKQLSHRNQETISSDVYFGMKIQWVIRSVKHPNCARKTATVVKFNRKFAVSTFSCTRFFCLIVTFHDRASKFSGKLFSV